MKTENKDLPAFPFVVDECNLEDGLTKREYFAGLAMQGILADGQTGKLKLIAEDAVKVADALLEELSK